LKKEVYEESRCYLFLYLFLIYVFICFSFFYFFACLCVDINFHLLHLDIFFFVYHFSCYILVLFFFTCLLVLVFLLLCRFSLPLPNFFFYFIFWSACVLKTLPLFWIFLVQNVSSVCCIVFLFIPVVMCSRLSYLFLFFYHLFPTIVQLSFTIDTCAFFSLMCTLEDYDDQSYSSSPIWC
jgi:hypothetical protein